MKMLTLSRFQMDCFRSLAPNADTFPSEIPVGFKTNFQSEIDLLLQNSVASSTAKQY